MIARENPKADLALLALVERYATTLLAGRTDPDTMAGGVRQWLADNQGPDATAKEAARALHMSPRTLRRRLAKESTSFSELLNGFRHERAVEMLSDRRFGIADVAFLLGYSELSAFYRAFRRWTGRTPAEYRAQTRSDATD